jgi:CheY-like chemotaxis protein
VAWETLSIPVLPVSFLSRTRLLHELERLGGDRVFVPTTEALQVGAAVTVQLHVPDLAALAVPARVVSLQAGAATAPVGVVVQVSPAGLDVLRAALGLPAEVATRLPGRIEARLDCDFEARIVEPEVIVGVRIKSLSASGLSMMSWAPLLKGATLRLELKLPDGLLRADTEVLWVRPELKLSGLRFKALPAAQATRLRTLVVALQAQAQAQLAPRPAATGHAVLIADDEPSILDFFARVVSSAGHSVLRAARGDEALELLRKHHPALAFIDVLMPGLDGLALCQAVRADAVLAGTPLVLVSAMGQERLAEAARAHGASAALTKPMRLEAVRELLTRFLPR